MKWVIKTNALLLLALWLAACAPRTEAPTPTVAVLTPAIEATATDAPPAPPVATATLPPTPSPTTPPTDTPAPSPTPEPSPTSEPEQDHPEEAILILEPGPGSRLVSPAVIAGEADPTFEQNLVIEIISVELGQLALEPVTIQAELGERGPFWAEVSFEVTGEVQAFIQVYTTSARDGGVTHLSSVGVLLSESGPQEIRPVDLHAERIEIHTPQTSDTISGGRLVVEGWALASFEQHLLVELLDEDGEVIAFEPVTVQAPDLGFPGSYRAELSYSLAQPGPGRVVVRDPSVAFEGDMHLNSVEVRLEP
jgi:hypothetical protein